MDSASGLLGETGGTPSAEQANRIRFANDCKKILANMRNWSFEIKTGTPINIVNGVNGYALATDVKNDTSIDSVKVTDSKGNSVYYSQMVEGQFNYAQVNNLSDQGFWIDGDPNTSIKLYLNPTPTENVTNGINYRYFSYEGDFVALTDTTRIPSLNVLSWYVTAKVLYGYREQSQYQLAMNEFNSALEDLAGTDYKVPPHAVQKILSLKEAEGRSNNFKSYFGWIIALMLPILFSFGYASTLFRL